MIIVYILTDHPKSERVETVRRIFSNKYFAVSIVSVCPKNLKDSNREDAKSDAASSSSSSELKSDKFCEAADELEIEYYRIIASMNDSYMHHNKNHLIIVKDTSISVANSDTVADIVSHVKQKGNFDVSFLSVWQQRCDLYTNKEQVMSNGSMIVKTQSSSGIQAVMFSPEGRDIILGKTRMKDGQYFKLEKANDIGFSMNKEILNGNIGATCLVPNLINFDPTTAKSNTDYEKTRQCADPKTDPNQGTGLSSFWWILVLILIIILLIWGVYKLKNGYYS